MTDGGDASPPEDTAPGDAPEDTAAEDIPSDGGGMCMGLGNDIMAVGDLAQGQFVLIDRGTIKLIMARDARGIYCLSARCTHTGCIVPAHDAAGFSSCPCHFSRFDRDGRVQPGSRAVRDLPNFQVTLCNNRIYVNRGEEVPLGTRVPLP
jgi:Rieske Fe-S protein